MHVSPRLPAKPPTSKLDPPHPAATAPTYKVQINIAPWAYFTVDNDTTRHQTPEWVSLTAGPHQIHFTNPELHAEKTLSLDVPAHDNFRWAAGKLQD